MKQLLVQVGSDKHSWYDLIAAPNMQALQLINDLSHECSPFLPSAFSSLHTLKICEPVLRNRSDKKRQCCMQLPQRNVVGLTRQWESFREDFVRTRIVGVEVHAR